MKTNYLLPHKFKIIGWVLFILGLFSGLFVFFSTYQPDFLEIDVLSIYNYDKTGIDGKQLGFEIVTNNVADELALITFLLGSLFVAFSKEKLEDEFIHKLRTDSLIWAIIFNTVILILATIFVYDYNFFDIMVFNMFTPLLFFILRFNFIKLKSRSHEE